MFAGIGIFELLFLVIAVSLGSSSVSIVGAGSVIGILQRIQVQMRISMLLVQVVEFRK